MKLHTVPTRVQPKITCLFCVSMCQTLYVRVNMYKYIYVSVCMFRDLYICVSVTQSSSLCTSTPEAQLPSVCVCVSASVSVRTPARLHTSKVRQSQKNVIKYCTKLCSLTDFPLYLATLTQNSTKGYQPEKTHIMALPNSANNSSPLQELL